MDLDGAFRKKKKYEKMEWFWLTDGLVCVIGDLLRWCLRSVRLVG